MPPFPSDGTDWDKIVVTRRIRRGFYEWIWYLKDGTTIVEPISASNIRFDISKGYIVRVPKHLMVQEGL